MLLLPPKNWRNFRSNFFWAVLIWVFLFALNNPNKCQGDNFSSHSQLGDLSLTFSAWWSQSRSTSSYLFEDQLQFQASSDCRSSYISPNTCSRRTSLHEFDTSPCWFLSFSSNQDTEKISMRSCLHLLQFIHNTKFQDFISNCNFSTSKIARQIAGFSSVWSRRALPHP